MKGPRARVTFGWGAALAALATLVRLVWVLAVPTVPVSDFAMYRESANYLSEFGRLDPGFIYMPGFVALLAWIKDAGGELFAQKLLGVLFGGIGAAGLFALVVGLVDARPREGDGEGDGADAGEGVTAGWRQICPCPHAVTATFVYALWPAGVAMSSVVGTDMPAAALIVAALGLLVTLAPRRPLAAALAFGATMGLGAWMRAVALPLSGLALGFWLARRDGIVKAVGRTAAGLAATLLVLLPWGVRHAWQSGHLYFTDDHGGITALIGANPNSEGTYTRALNSLFKDVTGRGVLDEPHHETDRAGYALAREWLRFEPRYALGLAVLKADRLYDPESRLLYWSIFRPGVLVGTKAAFFAAHHDSFAGLADAFGLAVAGLALAGIALAVARRRWTLLALVPFQLALTATYTLFFAEPRYRLPIEMLAFPFVAVAIGELASAAAATASRSSGRIRAAAIRLAPALLVVVIWRLVWPAALDAGAGLRSRHRWVVTELVTGGRTATLAWGPAPPFVGPSPLAGAPNGVHVSIAPGSPTRVRLEIGGGFNRPGASRLRIRFEASGGPVEVVLAGASPAIAPATVRVAPDAPRVLELPVTRAARQASFEATFRASVPATLWASDASFDAS